MRARQAELVPSKRDEDRQQARDGGGYPQRDLGHGDSRLTVGLVESEGNECGAGARSDDGGRIELGKHGCSWEEIALPLWSGVSVLVAPLTEILQIRLQQFQLLAELPDLKAP